MADTNKLMTEKQTAALIGKALDNLDIEVDLSDYQTSEDASSALASMKSELEGKINKKADKADFDDLSGKVEQNEDDIDEIKKSLEGKVSSEQFSDLEKKVRTNENNIKEKADSSTVDGLTTRVGQVETELGNKATKTEVEAVKTELTSKLSSVYRYKGTKPSYTDLPSSGNEIGDVWDVNNGMNYAWNGTEWDALGDARVEVDATLSDTSTNPVQNKAIKAALDPINTKLDGMEIATQTDIDAAYNTSIKPNLTVSVTVK